MAEGHVRSLPGGEEWARACDLQPNGRGRWKGPCPLCGGKDRFHVEHRGGRVLVGCRGCMDGLGPASKRQFGVLLRQVFPERYGEAGPPPRPAEPASRESHPAPRPDAGAPANGAVNAAHVWVRAVAPDGTPARAYLAARLAWPPAGTGPELPFDVRWLAAAAWPPARQGRPRPPPTSAGAIAFAYRRRERLVAVDLEALTDDGRCLPTRWRRTVGPKQGAVFRAGGLGGRRIVLAEGPVDALACRWLHPEAECLATGGTAGLAGWTPHVDDDRPVLIEADGDQGGDLAAILLRERLGVDRVRVRWRRRGDPAGELAEIMGERAAIGEYDGKACRTEAERLAWTTL